MGLEGWAPESYVTAGFKDFLEGFKENWIGDNCDCDGASSISIKGL